MTKLIFIFSVLFAVSHAVLYGRDVAGKEDFSQGYRYSRPSPHYLPPHHETSTQASNHYYATSTPTPASQQQNWQQQSWLSNNFGSSNNFAQPTLAPPSEKPFLGTYRPDVPVSSNNNNDFNGYNYQNSPTQAVFVTTSKPNVGYQQMRPEYQVTEVIKPSSGYIYMEQAQNSKPISDISRPNPSGYNYMQHQASNPTEYFYNKPDKTSYNPGALVNSGYAVNAPSDSNYYNNAFVGHASSTYATPTFPTSLASSGTSYQRPNYENDFIASTSNNQIGSMSSITDGNHVPWYMNQKIESTNNYNNNNNWNLPQQQQQQQQFRPASPSRPYLPPKVEFQPPYYKK